MLLGIKTDDSFFFLLAASRINDIVLSPLLYMVTYLESSLALKRVPVKCILVSFFSGPSHQILTDKGSFLP